MPVFALTISPAKLEITGDPGTTINSEFELFNEQLDSKILYSSFSNFDSDGETGAPHFTASDTGLASWIKTDSSISLASNEKRTINFSVTIPKDAEPGGHFAAIFWGTQSPESQDGGQVSIGGKLGILVLLRVSGYVKEGSDLLGFGAKNNQKIFSTLPISLEYRINNSGGDRIIPTGQVIIRNLKLWNTATLLANKKIGSVLPGSVRKFEVVWGNNQLENDKKVSNSGFLTSAMYQLFNFHLGWYSAELSVVIAQDNEPIKKSFSFFVIPWQLLSIILLLFILFGGLGTVGLKRYNRWIIKKATQKT